MSSRPPRDFLVPDWIRASLAARNPYELVWDNRPAMEAFRALEGPDKEVAERLVRSLANFQPRHDDFDVTDIRLGLGTNDIKVTVETCTHLRLRVLAVYRNAKRQVRIVHFEIPDRGMAKGG